MRTSLNKFKISVAVLVALSLPLSAFAQSDTSSPIPSPSPASAPEPASPQPTSETIAPPAPAPVVTPETSAPVTTQSVVDSGNEKPSESTSPSPISSGDDITVSEDKVVSPDITVGDVGTPASPQVGTSSQGTIPSSQLENAVNPQQQEVSESVIIAPVVSQPVISQEDVEQAIEIIDSETEKVTQLEPEVLIPQKEYTFALDGTIIATKENPEWTQTQVEKVEKTSDDASMVTNVPSLNLNANPNSLVVSGSCSDPYFVILIYRESGDYDQNPSSYIFNKAYPCIAGQYSYSVSELPFNLESGHFYLLVGAQGLTGSWKPISALIPIGIQIKTTYVNASGTPVDEIGNPI